MMTGFETLPGGISISMGTVLIASSRSAPLCIAADTWVSVGRDKARSSTCMDRRFDCRQMQMEMEMEMEVISRSREINDE